MLAGLNPTGEVPVPDSGTDCGLSAASSANRSVAALAPSPSGRKRTSVWHDAPGATVAPEQESATMTKLAAPVPATVAVPMLTSEAPRFVNVAVCGALCAPQIADPKPSCAGDSATGEIPLPESGTT